MSIGVLDLAENGFTEETLEWYREQSDRSLYFFNKVVLGYPDLTVSLHKPLCDWIVKTQPKRSRGILMPRKFFKSTNIKGYTLWKLSRQLESGKLNSNLRILFVGENDQVGAKNLNDVKWHIQNNRLFQALYPELIPPDFSATKWTDNAILLPREKSFDEPTITCIGIGAKHTGFHYDLIIYDDPIGLEAAQSPAEMQRAVEWFKAAPGLLDSPQSEEIITGTRWKDGRGDLYGWIMEELPYRETPEGSEGYQWYIRKAIENDQSIFPERYPLVELEKIRKRAGPYLWACNYQNDPITRENVDFPDDWIKTYRVDGEARHNAIISDTGERVNLNQLVRVTVYDPSSGGKSAGAENAIVVVGMDWKRRVFVVEAWSKNCGFGEAIEKWHQLNDRWKPWRNWFEGIGAHKEVGEMLKMRPLVCDYCHKQHSKLMPRLIEQAGIGSRSKEDRIRALAQPAFEEGRVYLREGMESLRRQITSFPHLPLVDMFDALAYAISLLRPPTIVDGGEGESEAKARARTTVARTYTGVDYGGYA